MGKCENGVTERGREPSGIFFIAGAEGGTLYSLLERSNSLTDHSFPSSIDIILYHIYYVIAHFHYVLSIGTIYSNFGYYCRNNLLIPINHRIFIK